MSVIISVGTKRSTISGTFPKDDIDFATSAYVQGYQYSSLFHKKRSDGSRIWDGKIHLFSRINNTFATGVLDIVCDVLKLNQTPYTIETPYIDELNLPLNVAERWGGNNKLCGEEYRYHLGPEICTKPLNHFGMHEKGKGWVVPDTCGEFNLYDYQKEACEEFFKPRQIPYRGVIKIGTGGGKTVCGATIARVVDAPTLFLVHGKKLARQNHEVFKKVFHDRLDDIGFIDSKTWSPNLITIASSDTLYSRMKNIEYEDRIKELFKDIVLVIVDECHRSTSKSFVEILKSINAPMRLGLSGTPNKKEDDRDLLLHSLTGSIIYEMGVSKLKEAGTISKAHLVSVIINKPELREDLDWLDAYDYLIVNNAYRHNVISKLVAERANAGKTILVLAGNSLALADNLFTAITKLIDPADVRLVNGLSENSVVDSAFKDLQDKKVKVVITTTISDEGLDIPAINCLVVAGGGKSFVKTVQRVGRALRLKDDGGHAEILDVMDNTNEYLRKHSKARLDHYESEGLFDSVEIIKGEDV
jgi:superfamily II DNA or RNA helicase